MLGTWPPGIAKPVDDGIAPIEQMAWWLAFSDRVEAALGQSREFFVGMAQGPFMVLLKPRNSTEFLEYARREPTHNVWIHWSHTQANGREWWIEPADGSDAYRLHFGLPAPVGDWVFDSDRSAPRRALLAKEDFFSDLTLTVTARIEMRSFAFCMTPASSVGVSSAIVVTVIGRRLATTSGRGPSEDGPFLPCGEGNERSDDRR